MSWLRQSLNSVIGMKFLMAASGILLSGFIVSHMLANLLVFADPDALTQYALGLRKFPALLWIARIGLLLSVVVHIITGVRLTTLSRGARPTGYAVKTYRKASFASRSMALSGLVVFAFLVYHLAHLTFKVTHEEFASLDPFDLYRMITISFRNPILACFYLIGVSLLGMHLSHGISSLFQTLGCDKLKYRYLLRKIGPAFGFVVAIGFGSVPVAVWLGLIGQ